MGDRLASKRQETVAGTEVKSDKGLNLGKWQWGTDMHDVKKVGATRFFDCLECIRKTFASSFRH